MGRFHLVTTCDIDRGISTDSGRTMLKEDLDKRERERERGRGRGRERERVREGEGERGRERERVSTEKLAIKQRNLYMLYLYTTHDCNKTAGISCKTSLLF